MSKHLSLLFAAWLSSAAWFGVAQQPVKISKVPVRPTPIEDGKAMYTSYCAVCHGVTGAGNGPAAAALKIPPPDLTLLSQKNKGVFPASHVQSVLNFGTENPAHGTPEMPIWSNLLRSLSTNTRDNDAQVHLRESNLADYLRQLQK